MKNTLYFYPHFMFKKMNFFSSLPLSKQELLLKYFTRAFSMFSFYTQTVCVELVYMDDSNFLMRNFLKCHDMFLIKDSKEYG